MHGMQGWTGIRAAGCGLILLALAGCGGDDSTGNQSGFSAAPGLGDSNANPTGTPFAFPAGISTGTVVGALHPVDGSGQKILSQPQCTNFTSAPVETLNVAFGYVDLCIELLNGNGAATSFTLPAGLIFISRDSNIQNGLLAQTVDVTVPAGSKWILLRLYCLNQTYPGADGRQYRTGPITDYAALQEILNIIRDKQIDQGETSTVQSAVWHVTDNPAGLTQSDRAALNGL